MSGALGSTELDRWLDELARRWERYFGNDPKVPLPPERETAALDRLLKEQSRSESRSTADRFKLQQQLHRFATYRQLWQRQLRQRESFRGGARPAPEANEPAPAPVAAGEEDEIGRLHRRFTELSSALGAGRAVELEPFRKALDAQRRQLEEKGAQVEGFEVVEDEGRVKVRARMRRRRS